MLTSENVLLTSGVVLTVLISATLISYTSKFFVIPEKVKAINQMYDPDIGLNRSSICIFSEKPHSTTYERSPCFNKTLLQWYNPWLHHNLWLLFWKEIKTKDQLNPKVQLEAKTEKTENATAAPEPEKNVEVKEVREKPAEFVYSVLIGLLMVSGLVACWEVCKERLKRNEMGAAKGQERQCTLADFTINRHLRRESQQQTGSHLPRQASLELTAKVTQKLIHQSSLDKAFPKYTSEALNIMESRRNSMPLNLADIQQTIGKTKLGKRLSADVSTEDINSDLKRRFRHFIRRH